MTDFNFRRDLITRPILQWARGVMPALSQTEREAIDAGDTWWDAALFTGDPDWNELLAFPDAEAAPRRAGLHRRAGQHPVRHARRLEHDLGDARPAAPGLGLSEEPEVLRHDHPQGLRRPGLLRLRPRRDRPQDRHPLGVGGGDRHGAQQPGPGRADHEVRHPGPARPLAAAPGRRARGARLRPDQPRGRVRRRSHGRRGRGLPRDRGRARTCWASA